MPPVFQTSSLSLQPTPGLGKPVDEVPVGPVAGTLVGLMVVVVAALAVVLLVVLVLRKRQKIPHEVDAQERTPTYRGNLTNRLCTRVHMSGLVNVKTL